MAKGQAKKQREEQQAVPAEETPKPEVDEPELPEQVDSDSPPSEEAILDKIAAILPEELVDVLRERARRLAQPPAAEITGESVQVVVFNLEEGSYAIKAIYVETIEPLQDLTPIPCTPDFVVGVVNLRGRILSVLDLHRFLGLPAISTDGAHVIAVRAAGLEVGILASQVRDVRPLLMEELNPVLPTTVGIAASYTLGLTSDMIVFLDLQALMRDERIVVWEEVG